MFLSFLLWNSSIDTSNPASPSVGLRWEGGGEEREEGTREEERGRGRESKRKREEERGRDERGRERKRGGGEEDELELRVNCCNYTQFCLYASLCIMSIGALQDTVSKIPFTDIYIHTHKTGAGSIV